jgi:hypothetical protein
VGEHPRMLTLLAGILTFSSDGFSSQEGTRDLNGNSTVRVQAGCGGDQVVAHLRLHTPPNTRNGRSCDPYESEITLNRRPRAREAGQ